MKAEETLRDSKDGQCLYVDMAESSRDRYCQQNATIRSLFVFVYVTVNNVKYLLKFLGS